jgi:hypothetical protein
MIHFQATKKYTPKPSVTTKTKLLDTNTRIIKSTPNTNDEFVFNEKEATTTTKSPSNRYYY